MTRLSIVLGALVLAMPALALARQDAPVPAPTADDSKSFDLSRTKIAQCPGERFDFEVADQASAKGTKVALCSNPGASKDDVAAMLESAIRQLESTDRMSPENRDQIVAQIRARPVEILAH